LALACALALGACGPPAPPRVTAVWVVGQNEPAFDPAGPPDPVRWSLERLLGAGLVVEDTTGRIAEGVASRWDVTPDGLTYTFHLRPDLRFADGRACGSADVRRSLESGLNRVDHATYPWLLSPIVGVDRVRAGHPLPPLGIATPDERTVVVRLARADPTLLHKLAFPGSSNAWSARPGDDPWAGGVGPYGLIVREPGRRMVLAKRSDGAGPDTIRVEFAAGAARARSLLRRGPVDLLWPVPPGYLREPLARDYRAVQRDARPARRLLLVLRADYPPTSKSEARRALAHGLNDPEILATLGPRGVDVAAWLSGGTPLEFPRRDAAAVREWLDRGRIGRSLHVVMAFAQEGAGAEVARPMQNEWARLSLDVELRPLRNAAFQAQALAAGGAQLQLLEWQAPLADPVAELATLVMPRRGPPVGAFRTGWATREFDRWIGPQPPETPLDVEYAQRRLGEELIALPLARLPWLWVERGGGVPVRFHPHFGPVFATANGRLASGHLSH
jgi:hypothetical protein